MPFSCPNKNTPEWKRLFLAVGKDRAYELYTENNFDIPTNFVVRAQDIRKVIKLYKTEIGQDKLIKVKKALDRYNTVNNTSHSLDITPIGESTESKVKLVLNFNPRNAQKYQDKLDRRSEKDKMFKELEEESETEEFVRDIDYFMGDEQLMQQEDGVFYQTNEKTVNNIKPGVSELFESNPELANSIYEALGSQITPQQKQHTIASTIFELEPDITKEKLRTIYDNYVALMNRRREGKAIPYGTFESLLKTYQVYKHKDTYIFGNYDINTATFITRMNSSPSSKELLAEAIPNLVKNGLDFISFVPKDYADKLVRSGYTASVSSFNYNFKGEDMIKYLATTNPEKVKQIFGKDISEITGEEIKNYNSQQELKYTPVEINSSLIEKAGKDASKILETYLNQFGIVVKDINEIKDKLEIDEIGFADLLSKIAYVKDKKDLPPIAGEFIAYMMQYNPLVEDIITEFSQTDKYKNLDKSQHFKIIGELISQDLQNKVEGNYNKSLLDKIKELVNKFFELFKTVPIDIINTNIGIISNNILQQNKKLITASLYKPGAFGKPTQQVNIEEALKKDKFGANIIYKLSKVGFILTGSTALSEQGVILRPNENPLHDIDWVSPFSRKETEEKFLKFYPNAIKVRDIYGDGYMTDSYLIAPEGYSISNYKADNFNGKIIINSYDVVDSKGNVVGTYRLQKQESNNQSKEVVAGIEGKVIDFFSYENYSSKNTNKPFNYKSKEGTIIQLANWKNIFEAKLNFARYKDIWDYNRFIPNENANQITQQQKQKAQQLYSQYLDTVFPDSKVRDIVTHFSKNEFEVFDKSRQITGTLGKAFYFYPYISSKEEIEYEKRHGNNVRFSLLNINKLGVATDTKATTLQPLLDNNDGVQLNNTEIVVFEPEQIHILSSKQDIEGFKEFVSKGSYQIESSRETPDSRIESTIKSWLEKVGIKYSAVDKIYDNEGNEINAVAKADILAKLIEVVEGKRGIDTLPEEAGHILVRMLGSEHPLVQVMMKNISNYKIYQDVIENDNYVRAYNNDETKLREEAVGKMIAQVLVAKMTGKELNPEQRKEESRILAAWKWLVNRLSRLVNTNAKDELYAFKQAADIIIEHSPIEVSEEFKKGLFSGETIFYEMDESIVGKVLEKLKGTNAFYDITQKAYFTKEGKRIKSRVSDIVKKMESRWFPGKRAREMPPENKKHAATGTITHAYFKEVTLSILEQVKGELNKAKYAKVDFATIQKRVLAELRQDPELVERGDDFLKSFNETHFKEVIADVTRRLERIQATQDFINKETGRIGKVEVFPEFTIFNPEKDLAGTIDLLVVYSNGKASVYDYKGQYFKTDNKKVVGDFLWTKVRSGREQTSQYKDMLKEAYGIEEFIEVRLVPFNYQYNRLGNIAKIEVGNTASDREYLTEVPTGLEKTGVKFLDEQLKKMFDAKKQLEDKLVGDFRNDKVVGQLERLNRSIKKLIVDRDTRYVYQEVNAILLDVQQRLTRPDALGVNFEYLNDAQSYLEMYKDFFMDAKKLELDQAETPEARILIENKYNGIYVKIRSILRDINEKKEDLIAANHAEIDFDKPVQQMSQLGSLFTRFSQFSRGQFKALYKLVAGKEQYVRTKVQEVFDELKERRETLNTWARGRGMSLQDAVDMMIDIKKGKLKSKFSGVYSEEKAKAIKNKDYKWFEENTQIERTATGYRYKNEEQAKKFQAIKDSKWEEIEKQNPGDFNAELRDRKQREWASKHDITTNRDAIFEQPYYINLVEQERFMSDFWKFASKPENKPLMDAYNSIVQINTIAAEVTGRKIEAGFIAEIQQGIIESLGNWNMGITALKDNIKRSFMVHEQDTMMGRRDVNTGEEIPDIPLLYTNEITVSLASKELNEIKAELKKEGILEGSNEYIERLEVMVNTREREKGILLKSRDLFTSALLFAESAYSYEYAKSIEEEAKALKFSLQNVETELTSSSGKKLLDKLTGKIAKVVGAPKDELEAFEKFIQLYIYGRHKQNKDFTTEGGVSANKSIAQAMRYTSLKALGLSWIVAIGNATGLAGNLLMAASEGKYYNKSQVIKAMSMMRGGKDKKRINAILQYISPYTHNITYEKSRKLSTKTAKKVLNEDLFYVFMKYPDMAVDIINALAILQNYGIDEQGRVRKVDGKIKPIIETLDTSGDKVTGLTETQYTAIRKLITTSSVKLKGNIFKEDANLIGTNVYLSMFMQFRNWMPGLIEQRFGKLKYNEDIGELEVGRFKVAYGEFTAKGVMPKLAAFIDLGMEVLSFGAYRNFSSKANRAVAEKYFQTFLEQNPELKGKVTMEQFMELREQKLRGMAMELRILLSLLGLLQLVRAAIPDDDEDKVQEWIAKNAYRITNRGLMEIMFFFDPGTVKQIAGRPLPLLNSSVELFNFLGNTIDETRDLLFEKDYKGVLIWEEDKKDKTKPLYYTSKMVPTRFFTDFIDFFDTFNNQIR